jgi:putative phosphoesterase
LCPGDWLWPGKAITGRQRNRGLTPRWRQKNEQFKKLLAPGKIGQTLCLGNLTDRTTYEYLRSVAPDLKIVKGRFDVEATSLPLSQVVTHGSIRVGFLEGFTLVSNEPDLLLAEANKLDVDVLCWGGTHRFECFEYMDKFFINPGSATGAFSTGWGKEEDIVPSFCLMDVSILCCRCSPARLGWLNLRRIGFADHAYVPPPSARSKESLSHSTCTS